MRKVRSGNRVDERCRFERQALRPFTPEEVSPSFAADRSGRVGLGTRRRRTLCSARLSYAPKGGGTRTRNHRIQKEPPPAQQADSTVKVRDNCRGIVGCEARARTWTSCFRDRRGSGSTTSHCTRSVWTERFELPTSGFRSRCAPVAPRPGVMGTDGGSRTRTDGGLSAVPLPVGLRQREVSRWVDRAGVEPATFSLQGSCASGCATGPVVARAGIEPACRAYETPLITRSLAGVTGRTRTGFLRGHDPASRPLQPRPPSTRRDSNPRLPPCEGGGLPADLLVVCVGRRGVEPRRPAVSARCLPHLAHALVRTWSRECSNLPLPGFDRPLHRQSFETARSALGRRSGRRRGSNPLPLGYGPSVLSFRTSPARVWSEGVEPSPSAWGADVRPLTPRPRPLGPPPARPVPGGGSSRRCVRCPCS